MPVRLDSTKAKLLTGAMAIGCTLSATATLALAADQGERPQFDPEKVRSKAMRKFPGITMSAVAPANFPVPIYPSSKTLTNFVSSPQSKVPAAAGMFITSDPLATVYAWYKQNVTSNGWSINNVAPSAKEKAGLAYIINATKNGTTVMITCTRTKKGDSTLVHITSFTPPPTQPPAKG